MKKLFMILASLSVLLLLSGCGGGEKKAEKQVLKVPSKNGIIILKK
jgi:hypothetical protein